jgi:hypothetical protein
MRVSRQHAVFGLTQPVAQPVVSETGGEGSTPAALFAEKLIAGIVSIDYSLTRLE